MIKGDFHLHTNAVQLNHGRFSPKELIDKAASYNFQVLSFTEHARIKNKFYKNYLRSYDNARQYAKTKNILLIPGAELQIENCHVLAINFKANVEKYHTFDDLYKLKNENVVLIAAHPFYIKHSIGKKLYEHNKLFDAFEISHFYTRWFNPNKKTFRYAKKINKPLIASSDAHHKWQFNNNHFTMLDCEKNLDSVLEAIRKGRLEISTRPISSFQFLKTLTWITVSLLKKYDKEVTN